MCQEIAWLGMDMHSSVSEPRRILMVRMRDQARVWGPSAQAARKGPTPV